MITNSLLKSVNQHLKLGYFYVHRKYHKLFVRYPTSKPNMMSIEFNYPADNPGKEMKRFTFHVSKKEDIGYFLDKVKSRVNFSFERIFIRNSIENLPNFYLSDYFLNELSIKMCGSDKYEIKRSDVLNQCLVENSILTLNDTEYIIVINRPIILNMKLPRIIYSNFVLMPLVELDHGKLTDFQFEWFISNDEVEWKSVHKGLTFTPSIEYNLYFVRVVAYCNETCQKISVDSKSPITESPTQKAMINRWEFTKMFIDHTDIIRLLSYNILAAAFSSDSMAKTQLFRHCPENYLTMEHRRHLLTKEIHKYHSDIICLQEIERSLFVKWLKPLLNESGYEGLLIVKTGFVPEGQAIFWRRSKLRFVEDISVTSLSDLILNNSISCLTPVRDLIRSSEEEVRRWMELKQCMAGCVLETSDGQQLMIANTHLYFQTDSPIVRLFQMAAVIGHLEAMQIKYPRASLVLCGDFNAVRGTPVIDFIEKAKVSVNVNSSKFEMYHGQKLLSAYNVPFTNFTMDFNGEIDYIYYDNYRLQCHRTIPLPSLDEVSENVALPNKEFPSDHLALVAELKFRTD